MDWLISCLLLVGGIVCFIISAKQQNKAFKEGIRRGLLALQEKHEKKFAFYDAFWWLWAHPIFILKGKQTKAIDIKLFGRPVSSGFNEALDFNIVKVNPETNRIEDEEFLNTKVMVWMETGPFEDPSESEHSSMNDNEKWMNHTGIPTHDVKLDCSGDTFEEAIVNLAKKVKEEHGDYDKETQGAKMRQCFSCKLTVQRGWGCHVCLDRREKEVFN
jgi:hypothetical protein